MTKLENALRTGGWILSLAGVGMGIFGGFLIDNKLIALTGCGSLITGICSFGVDAALCGYNQKKYGGYENY